MGFLDASKLNTLLFQKLIDRKLPGYIIRTMVYWYASQTMHVLWSGILSHGFHVANGVRQGDILSPYLFNVYIDDLRVARAAMNHFMYSDDLVLFSPSSVGLRALIAVCERYGINHEIRKSAIMICRGHYMKNVHPPLYTLNGEVIKEVDNVRYQSHIISNNGKYDKDIMRQCQE